MNVLYIHTHDSGRILSPYGYQVPTPNMERFARDAVVFRNCYCAGPTCSPSRAAMLSGRYPHQNGMLGLAQRGFSMNYRQHLVQYLNHQNFHTVLCGIQHEAGWYLDTKSGAEKIGYLEEISCSNEGYRQEDLVEWDKKNAGQVCAWLKEYEGSKPFFLSFGMYATHRRYPDQIDSQINPNYVIPPNPTPDTRETREDFARYMTSVKQADTCFGMVLDSLKNQGLLENTIVLFTTDHGLANPFCKCTLFDSGIGVNFMMRCPGYSANGSVVDGLISHIDVFPTLCELLGLEKPEYLEGISFKSMLKDTTQKVREEIYAEVNFHTSYEPIRCIRTERYKYIRYYDTSYLNINYSNIDESCVKDYYQEHGLKDRVKYQEALYDLIYDKDEVNNLSEHAAYQDVKHLLCQKLDCHLQETKDSIIDGFIPILPEWKVNKQDCQIANSKNPSDYVSMGRGEV